MGNVFKGLWKYRKWILITCILIIVTSLAELLLPSVMNVIIDDGIGKKNMDVIWTSGVQMMLIIIVGFGSQVFCTYLSSRVVSNFTGDLIEKIYSKVDKMNYVQYAKLGPSALLARSTDDPFAIGEAVYFLIRIAITLPVLLIGGFILSARKDLGLSLTLLAFAPVAVTIVWFVARRIFDIWTEADEYIDKQNQLVRDRLSGIRVIRAFNREKLEHGKIKSATDKMSAKIVKANIINGLIDPIALLILNFITVIILYAGGMKVSPQNGLSAGDVVAITQYVTIMMNGILMFSFALVFLPRIKVKCQRINEILKVKTIDNDEPTGEKFKGKIELKDVSFKYTNSEVEVLKEVNIKIPEGKTVAFVGGTGSGKTTCLQLIMDLQKPTSGEIFIGDKNYDELNSSTVRDNLAVVLQKSNIFSATIKENILMGNENAQMDDVIAVCNIAEIESYIEGLEEKYEHKIEQAGANLSGGQKQRIAIARAILKDAPIYIFDDSFSALDFLTESRLRKKLNQRLKGKTQIIITQRISTAMSADYIYAFHEGKIVGEGKHKDMLENCSIYKEIYNSQVGGDLSNV